MNTAVDQSRVEKLNREPVTEGPVIYWMSRDQRVQDNWALLYAQEMALERRQPLVVIFCLAPEFLGATLRQYRFMLQGLAGVEMKLRELDIGFFLLTGDPGREIIRFCREVRAGALVGDFSPLRINRCWKASVAENLPAPFFEVDAHNIVPCRLASEKQEYAAYTFRPKIKKLLPGYLTDYPPLKPHPHPYPAPAGLPQNERGKGGVTSWQALEKTLNVERTAHELTGYVPGEKAGREAMEQFINAKLPAYAADRNDPSKDGQSNLSPYLHFGQLSPQRLAFEVAKAGTETADAALETSKEEFLEELVVRRELSDNYCFYNEDYDNPAGFPRWARENLEEHKQDPREYLYSRSDFEEARTHDQLWNAAQNEMVVGGKMHGYMRMYWAKKILEWTETPEQAQAYAIYLNDKYSLDGRDPNGYSGIAWSIGGVHDRAWGERPVFGKVRYMSYRGIRSKFNIDAYLARVRALMQQ